MFLSNAAVRRPIAMGALIVGLTLLGANAFRKLGLELLPKMDAPFVTVTTIYPGASPEQIEVDVAKRIEDQVVSIDGLKHVSSSCMENVCQTSLEFNMDVDVDIAATDVREKLDLIRSDLPEDAEDPKILKFDINATPVIHLAFTGDVPLDELYDYADNTLRDRLTVISGVANVELVGGASREVHVELDRAHLAARGLSSMDVLQTVQMGVRKIPSGRVRESGTEYTVEFDADYNVARDIGNLEIANEGGRRCYIRDVARVEMDTEELRQKATIDGRPAIAIKVVKKADANAVRVVNRVREAMDKINQSLPGGMELIWVADDGRFVEASVNSAWGNVGQGILLTAAILFLFLYNVRATLVVAITMPLTILIGLFFMQLVGYTLNTSTLIAIGLSVGILVTNSIVVLEAIVRRLDETDDASEAARLGASEATIAVLASAGTNVVVLFPIAMMGGKTAMFMRPLSLTMLIMTVVSLFISFTLTPLLCSLMLKPREEGSRSPLALLERGWNWVFDRVVRGYRQVLTFNERWKVAAVLVLLAIVGLFVHAMSLANDVGFGFFSGTDKGQLFVKMEFPTRYDLAKTSGRVLEVEERLKGVPELRHVLSTIGKVEGVIGKSSEGVYLAQVLLRFSERDERQISIDDLIDEVRSRLKAFPDCIMTVSQPSLIGGQSSPIELEIAGGDLRTLDELALQVQGFTHKIPGAADPDTSVRIGKPKLRIVPRRAVLSDLGLPATSLGMALRANLEGLEAGTFKRGDRNYDIVVKFAEQEGKDQVEHFLFPGAPGHPILLASLGELRETLAPIQITRKNKRRVSKLFAELDRGAPLGTVVDAIDAQMDAAKILPPGYDPTFAGQYEMMQESQVEMGEAMITAVVLVILTLAAIMESLRQPALILVTIPLGLVGVMYALFIAGLSLDLFVLMGIIMLTGIVVNNAILIMDQFNVHVAEGVPRHRAMIGAACERFRPIAMITLAAVLGMMPLAVGSGIGAEMRNGVGVASVGGILVSGILALLVVPILYDLCTRRSEAPIRKSNAVPQTSPGAALAAVPPRKATQ